MGEGMIVNFDGTIQAEADTAGQVPLAGVIEVIAQYIVLGAHDLDGLTSFPELVIGDC